MIIPIHWRFHRSSMLPIIEAICESSIKGCETIMIHDVLDIIEKANQFEGIPFSNKPSFPITSSVSVSFSLIFPTETDADKFMEFLQK